MKDGPNQFMQEILLKILEMTPEYMELQITRDRLGMEIIIFGRENNFHISDKSGKLQGIARNRWKGIGCTSNLDNLLLDVWIFVHQETSDQKIGPLEMKFIIDEYYEKYKK